MYRTYKQLCMNCKKNMVIIRSFRQRPICESCQNKSVSNMTFEGKWKKLFDIDPKFYEQSSFLKDIRYQYSVYHNLTDKQIAAFKKVVQEFENPKKKEEKVVPKKAPKPKRVAGAERSVLRALRTK